MKVFECKNPIHPYHLLSPTPTSGPGILTLPVRDGQYVFQSHWLAISIYHSTSTCPGEQLTRSKQAFYGHAQHTSDSPWPTCRQFLFQRLIHKIHNLAPNHWTGKCIFSPCSTNSTKTLMFSHWPLLNFEFRKWQTGCQLGQNCEFSPINQGRSLMPFFTTSIRFLRRGVTVARLAIDWFGISLLPCRLLANFPDQAAQQCNDPQK